MAVGVVVVPSADKRLQRALNGLRWAAVGVLLVALIATSASHMMGYQITLEETGETAGACGSDDPAVKGIVKAIKQSHTNLEELQGKLLEAERITECSAVTQLSGKFKEEQASLGLLSDESEKMTQAQQEEISNCMQDKIDGPEQEIQKILVKVLVSCSKTDPYVAKLEALVRSRVFAVDSVRAGLDNQDCIALESSLHDFSAGSTEFDRQYDEELNKAIASFGEHTGGSGMDVGSKIKLMSNFRDMHIGPSAEQFEQKWDALWEQKCEEKVVEAFAEKKEQTDKEKAKEALQKKKDAEQIAKKAAEAVVKKAAQAAKAKERAEKEVKKAVKKKVVAEAKKEAEKAGVTDKHEQHKIEKAAVKAVEKASDTKKIVKEAEKKAGHEASHAAKAAHQKHKAAGKRERKQEAKQAEKKALHSKAIKKALKKVQVKAKNAAKAEAKKVAEKSKAEAKAKKAEAKSSGAKSSGAKSSEAKSSEAKSSAHSSSASSSHASSSSSSHSSKK
eukprot:CAMPEP_0114554388 /NCGR_PEP_ID=MMETSP0114-20121206/8186_1 /TAXON_ID=31324 /ORGANISM="Goniomonas sp, Strain m" /LENGTH=503 /DNA_ID=CAMNT_0001739437 /DNA_START=11 /DNA_END=1522 /DNA_ORIENTATION=+